MAAAAQISSSILGIVVDIYSLDLRASVNASLIKNAKDSCPGMLDDF